MPTEPPAPADTGLFGPGSVTWRVHTEPILFLAGFRALFLQALHPRAIAGVTQNSGYKADPWGRFLRTVEFVSTTIHGTTEQAEAMGRRVRAVHARLSAVDPATGERFRIDEPELLRWVHVTEVESYASTARRAGVRLTAADWDGYFDEQRRRAALVGLDPATVPGSTAEVAEYFREIRPRLRMTREAADTLVFLATPPPPWQASSLRARVLDRLGRPPFRLTTLGVATTAFALLPGWARRLYGMPGLPSTDLAATVSARALRLALHAVPQRLFAALPGPPPPAPAAT
ncbi:MAG TPA: oxygenase MpaB family protein [Natronosporangium sp.]